MNLLQHIHALSLAALIFGVGQDSLYAQNQGLEHPLRIESIEAGELADIVAISGGLQQGIERGMLLTVFRQGRKIGELLVTRSNSRCSAALITELSPNESFKTGDRATPKVRKF